VGLACAGSFRAYAGDIVQVRTNFYAVKGETARELRRSLDINRPKGQAGPHDAETTWRIEWKSDVAKQNDNCTLKFLDVKTAVTITLPSWTPATNATPELKRFWKEYYVALMTHEWGHAQMALAVAAEMHARVREISPHANCEDYKRLIAEQARAVQRDAERKQKEYDEQTRHGASQGAVWRYGRPIWR
jgi:predicted secreted Zn-dependent protease